MTHPTTEESRWTNGHPKDRWLLDGQMISTETMDGQMVLLMDKWSPDGHDSTYWTEGQLSTGMVT